ncbi:MAG: putative bifunctional sugar kinase/nucleotidyltransferase [Microbacteriaceae bacterium]|nr:putative bifunctional sugar kinase/nucleotidyltransferase [Microbacteriaceae bacterium]
MTTGELPDSLSPQLVRRIADAGITVAVIGDVILDGWWHGRIERMSREAPAPVVEVTSRRYAPGGAANTALALASLGARVRIAGAVGDDEAGQILRSMLDAAGVDTGLLLKQASLGTTTKNRVVCDDQILLRVDDVPGSPVDVAAESRFLDAALAASTGADAEIISDYGAGLLGNVTRQALADRTERPALTVVDAHDLRLWSALAPHIVTPNFEELFRAIGAQSAPPVPRVNAALEHAGELLAASGARTAVVTLDREGTVVLSAGDPPYRTFAHPTPERQASGAGDTFAAALTLARAYGASLTLAADFAQLAADIVVGRPATAVCTTDDLTSRLAQPADPTLSLDELERRVSADRAAGQRIVFTNGCFDVLHRGHIASLRQAKQLGGVLVVALNDDASVRRLKGPRRPVNTASDRATVLASLEFVDYVVVFDSDTPISLIERLRPDVYAKGGDYTPDMLEETRVVRSYGGQVKILDYLPSQSTTGLVDRIRSDLIISDG